MKKLVALCLVGILVLGVLPSRAATPLIFTALEDVIQPNPTPATVPVKIGNIIYVLPQTFTRLYDLKTIYKDSLNQLIIFNSDLHMIFDIRNNMTFDESGKIYGATATKIGGTIYLPAALVCQKFGLSYSYISSSSLGSVVRINSEPPSYSNENFLEKNVDYMKSIYLQYNRNYNQETPPIDPTPDPDPEPDEEEEVPVGTISTRTTLMFQVTDEAGTRQILEQLGAYNVKAAFFVDGIWAQNGALLRQILVAGHTVGLSVGTEYLADATNINNSIKEQALLKSRVALLSVGTATRAQRTEMSEQGYRLWNPTYRVQGTTANRMTTNVKNHLSTRKTSSALLFSTGGTAPQAVGSVLAYLRAEGYTIYQLTQFDTPK